MDNVNRCTAIIVLGVCGAGKSTVASRLASALGWEFVEADDFHSSTSRKKMAQGIGLNDRDREPWLAAINAALRQKTGSWVLACSALKQRYRDTLIDGLTGVSLVWLHGNEDLLRLRLRRRKNHHAGELLLDSQLAALEPLTHGLKLDVVHEPKILVEEIMIHLAPQLSNGRPILASDN